MGSDDIISRTTELLWVGGLAATPLALLVGCVCRCKGLRPATRHMLWCAVLASFITPAIGAWIWMPHWFRSDRLIAAADSVLNSTAINASTLNAPLGAPASGSTRQPFDDLHDHFASISSMPALPEAPIAHSPRIADQSFIVLGGTEVSPPPTRAAELPYSEPMTGVILTAAPTNEPIVSESLADQPSDAACPNECPCPVKECPPCVPCADLQPASRIVVADSGPTSVESPTALAPRTPRNDEPAVPSVLSLGANPTSEASARVPMAAAPASTSHPVRVYLVRLLGVRDALGALPPVPGTVWFGGAALLLALSLWRTAMAGRWIRRATPAGWEVQQMVRRAGDTLGLSRVPRAVFVDVAVSPMIWCGFRPLLVLPSQLWSTLDEDSRRAVLVHELAHVRRWDHILCWAEAAIGAVYWWHPVVWWARYRLRDEAEASCDAWVTSLFPSGRRAYASALVVTKSYLSNRGEQRGPWLGVASSSAKRLARRITMVMTEKAAPKMSLVGACVTALVVAAGMFVMPGLACPPEQSGSAAKCDEGQAVTVIAPKANRKSVTLLRGQTAPKAAEPGVLFLGEAPALEAMKGGAAGGLSALTAPAPQEAPMAPMAPRAPKAPKAPKAPAPPVASFSVPGTWAGPAVASAMPRHNDEPVDLEKLKIGRTPHAYILSDGKLDAFYGLMSRNDVPILVQKDGDKIIIWGNDDEHAVFGKFIKIVGGGKDAEHPHAVLLHDYMADKVLAEKLAAGQARKAVASSKDAKKQYEMALSELTRNRDSIQRDADRARAQADAVRDRSEQLRELVKDLHGRAAEMAQSEEKQELEQAVKKLHSRSDTLQSESKSMESRVRQLEKMIEEIERRAEKLEQKLEEMNDDDNNIDDKDNDDNDVNSQIDAAMVDIAPLAEIAPDAAPEVPAVPAQPELPPTLVPDAAPAPQPASQPQQPGTVN